MITIEISPWFDPIVDEHGWLATSELVEHLWTPILGPTSILVLRRCCNELTANGMRPITVELADFALSFGLATNLFTKTVSRLDRFGMLRQVHLADEQLGWDVRVMLPSVPRRQYDRLPVSLRERYASLLREPSTSGAR